MHPLATNMIVKEIRQRVSEGDCPTIPPRSAGQLEDVILDLAGRLDLSVAEVERLHGVAPPAPMDTREGLTARDSVTDEMVTAAMRAFERMSSVLRYREKDKWHSCDIMGMRDAIAAALAALPSPELPAGGVAPAPLWPLIELADKLRAAQRTYLADRTQEHGAAVGAAAEAYDDARSALPSPHNGKPQS